MIIRPYDVHKNRDKARLGVGLTAEVLGIECDLRLTAQWLVKIDPKDGPTFLKLAQEEAAKA